MTKLATTRVAAGVAAGALAWVALGAFSALTSCAALLDIEDPLPRGDDGGSDATIADSSIPGEADSDADTDARDAFVLDADGASSDAPRLDADADADAPIPAPDAGYTVTVPTPAPQFIDACSLPEQVIILPPHMDYDTGPLPLPVTFAFAFYGVLQTQYWVNTHGVMGFGMNAVRTPYVQCPLPKPNANPHPAIYAFGDYLYVLRAAGCSALLPASPPTWPNQRFVVTWEDAQLSTDSSSHLTFSVVLTQNTNTIDLMYGTLTGDSQAHGAQATIGLEDATGTLSTQVWCGTPMGTTPFVTMTPFDVHFAPKP